MPFHNLIFCLNMAKLYAVLISSLRLYQSRLPLNFYEFEPNICDLSILYMKAVAKVLENATMRLEWVVAARVSFSNHYHTCKSL